MKVYEAPSVQVSTLTATEAVAFGDNLQPLSSMVQPK